MFDTQCLTNLMFFLCTCEVHNIFTDLFSTVAKQVCLIYTMFNQLFFLKKRKEIRSYAFIVCLILVTIFLRYSSDRLNTNILLMLKNSFHFNSDNIILKDYALNTQSSMEKGA